MQTDDTVIKRHKLSRSGAAGNRKPSERVRRRHVSVWCTDEEMEEWIAAADGLSLSSWAGQIIRRALRLEKKGK